MANPFQDTNLGGTSETRGAGSDPMRPAAEAGDTDVRNFAPNPDVSLSWQGSPPLGSAKNLLGRATEYKFGVSNVEKAGRDLDNVIVEADAALTRRNQTEDIASLKVVTEAHISAEDHLETMAAAAEGIMIDLQAMKAPQQQTGVDPTLGESIAGLAAILGGGGRRAAEDLVNVVNERQRTEFENQMAQFQLDYQNKQTELSMAQQSKQFAQQMVQQAAGFKNQAARQQDAQAHSSYENELQRRWSGSEAERSRAHDFDIRKRTTEANKELEDHRANIRREDFKDEREHKEKIADIGRYEQALMTGKIDKAGIPVLIQSLKDKHGIDLSAHQELYEAIADLDDEAKQRLDKEWEMKEEAHAADLASSAASTDLNTARADQIRAETGMLGGGPPTGGVLGGATPLTPNVTLRDEGSTSDEYLANEFARAISFGENFDRTTLDASGSMASLQKYLSDKEAALEKIAQAEADIAKIKGKKNRKSDEDRKRYTKARSDAQRDITDLSASRRQIMKKLKTEQPDLINNAIDAALYFDEYFRRLGKRAKSSEVGGQDGGSAYNATVWRHPAKTSVADLRKSLDKAFREAFPGFGSPEEFLNAVVPNWRKSFQMPEKTEFPGGGAVMRVSPDSGLSGPIGGYGG